MDNIIKTMELNNQEWHFTLTDKLLHSQTNKQLSREEQRDPSQVQHMSTQAKTQPVRTIIQTTLELLEASLCPEHDQICRSTLQ